MSQISAVSCGATTLGALVRGRNDTEVRLSEADLMHRFDSASKASLICSVTSLPFRANYDREAWSVLADNQVEGWLVEALMHALPGSHQTLLEPPIHCQTPSQFPES